MTQKRNPGALAGVAEAQVFVKADHAYEAETSTNPVAKEARSGSRRAPFIAQKRWAAAHPTETWAHAALRSAMRRGLVQRQPCAECGDPETDGHHADHYRPLDMVWLCRRHHRQVHIAQRADNGCRE